MKKFLMAMTPVLLALSDATVVPANTALIVEYPR